MPSGAMVGQVYRKDAPSQPHGCCMKKRAAWPKAARSISPCFDSAVHPAAMYRFVFSLRRLTPRPPSSPDRTVWALRLSSWPGLSIPVLLRGSLIVLRSLSQLSRVGHACQCGKKNCRRRARAPAAEGYGRGCSAPRSRERRYAAMSSAEARYSGSIRTAGKLKCFPWARAEQCPAITCRGLPRIVFR